MGKYIQDTKLWKEANKVAAKEWNEAMDEAIIKAVEGPALEKAKPPKGPAVALSTT
jgi:hypothetical protein